jgi:hypothetical protein
VGWVNVGQDHETAAFAVESLRRWWRDDGALAYPDADQLLICADGGGSNGYRGRAWKHELWRFALEAGLAITVCHLPPGWWCAGGRSEAHRLDKGTVERRAPCRPSSLAGGAE